MFKLTKSGGSVRIYCLLGGRSEGADSPMEDLKVFIDVNVELGTNLCSGAGQ